MQFKWIKYHKLTAARKDFAIKPCIYIQADSSGIPIRVGKAGKGLEARYRGGTGYALDAAMHGSGNLVFVAAVPHKSCANAEAELIWRGRMVLPYNNVGKKKPPSKRIDFSHTGTAPDFSGFESH